MDSIAKEEGVRGETLPVEQNPETIPIAKIRISRLNPRCDYQGDLKSLLEDIKDGQLHPIIVRLAADGFYEVICGGRRFRARRELRGQEGVLNSGEFKIVAWTDARCIKASVSENEEREGVPPLVAGQYLTRIAEIFEKGGEKVTDTLLAERTGIARAMVNDLRGLADKAGVLPASWRDALNTPPDCRSGDKPAISITHFKVIRGTIKDGISDEVRSLMERAAKDGWSVKAFTRAVDALKPEDQGAPSTTDEVNERDPDGDPDYPRVAQALKHAHRWVGRDDETARLVEAALKHVEAAIDVQRKQAKAAKDAAAAAKKDAKAESKEDKAA